MKKTLLALSLIGCLLLSAVSCSKNSGDPVDDTTTSAEVTESDAPTREKETANPADPGEQETTNPADPGEDTGWDEDHMNNVGADNADDWGKLLPIGSK